VVIARLPHSSTVSTGNLLLLLYQESPQLIDLDPPYLDVFFIPYVWYFYGPTASVYLHLYLRGERLDASSRCITSVDDVGCFHYYNIRHNTNLTNK
jgi:hypothetical protein